MAIIIGREMLKTSIEKLVQKQARIAVIGLGYVGLPLAVELAACGIEIIGIDASSKKVRQINEGQNYIRDVDSELLRRLVLQEKRLSASTDYSHLRTCDYITVCVPTPLGKSKEPDISFVISAASEISRCLKHGQVIILESTTYPGTTEEVVLPILEKSGLKVGKDFYLAYSPERIDPGNENYDIRNTPKVIGGVTGHCTEAAQALYRHIIDDIVCVASPRTAEMVKILENTFRAINIGLANEVAIMCNHLGIDAWEVIDAAATKPFGFMPFYPGPGLGGHCIPVDPHYLVWKLKSVDYHARFIQLAEEINSSMPRLVVDKVVAALNAQGKPVKDSKILILGVAYKADIDDYRESPALDVIQLLQQNGGCVSYHDPFIPELKSEKLNLSSAPIDKGLSGYDCVVILTWHTQFDIEKVVEESRAIVDTRNATKKTRGHSHKIIRL